MKPYTELLESLLVMEFGKSAERAKELVREDPEIVMQGILAGNQSLRPVTLLLDDMDAKVLMILMPEKPAPFAPKLQAPKSTTRNGSASPTSSPVHQFTKGTGGGEG